MNLPIASGLRKLAVPFALVLLAANTACGDLTAKHASKKPQTVRKVFVHGDPLQMVAGTEMSTKPVFDQAGLEAMGKIHLNGGVIYTSQTELVAQPTDLEKKNAADDGKAADAIEAYAVITGPSGAVLHPENAASSGLSLRFVTTPAGLALEQVNGIDVEPLHYSMNAAKDAFSVLFKVTENDTQELVALYFAKTYQGAEKPSNVDPKYNYLLGPGMRASWQDKIRLSYCGKASDADRALFKKGVEEWVKDGKIGTHAFELDDQVRNVPFSELGVNCIQMVDDYFFEDRDDYVVLGITHTLINKTNRQIYGAHILISRQGHTKGLGTEPNRVNTELVTTTAHEFGHFLGLDHEFDKDPVTGMKAAFSVMGYGDADTVTDYDRSAVEQLYGPYTE